MFKRIAALMLVLCLLMTGFAFAENVTATPAPEESAEPEASVEPTATPEPTMSPEEAARQYEEFDESIYEEPKVTISKDDIAITEGLDKDWRNILLLGSDARPDSGRGRTDAMLILSFNERTYEVKLTSLMRDIWTEMYGRAPQKLSAAHVFGGAELTIRTINEDFGMNIEDYVLINMDGFEKVIELMGGINMDITEAEMQYINESYNSKEELISEKLTECGEGTLLNGEQALAYVRLRKLDNDWERTARQRKLIIAVVQKATQLGGGELMSFINACMDYSETSLKFSDVLQLAAIGLQADVENIEQLRLPADGTYTSGVMEENNLWVMQPDFKKNTELLYEFIYGE